MKKFDLIIIGGGSAGHAAASTAASMNLTCALVEAPGELGGLCILRGCMPSKILIETANRMRIIREAERFGIIATPPTLDREKLLQRAHFLLSDFRSYRQSQIAHSGYELIRGTASMTGAHELTLAESGEKLAAKAIIIATGSKPSIPDIPGLADCPYWTSDDVVQMPEVPRSITIIGHGAIGMEAAHMFEGFGSQVTVLVRGERILTNSDADVSRALEAESIARGIHFRFNAKITTVTHSNGKFILSMGSSEPSISSDALLIATGREPNTIGFGFQKMGIAMDRKRILIDDRCSTSLPHVFAAGDCASPLAVVHLAVIQGKVAARNACRQITADHGDAPSEWHPETAMNGLFTEPQCVEIGMGIKEARDKGISILTGRVDYNDQGKGMITGSRHGFVKVIAEQESHRIIGAAAVGPEVIETSHVMQMAIHQQLTLEDYLAIPHYHPTLVEAWESAVVDALSEAEPPEGR